MSLSSSTRKSNHYLKKGQALVALVACLSLSGLAGCSSTSDPDSGDEPSPSFTIGSVMDPNINIPLLVAQSEGFFEAENVNVDIKLFPSGAEITSAIAGNSLQGAATGGVPLTILAGKGTDVRVVARDTDISYELAIMTLEKYGISTPEDIKGKTVAATFGTVSHYLILAFAEKYGIPTDSFTLVNLNPADQINALMQGSVQVVSVWDPFTTKLVDSGAKMLTTAIMSEMPGLSGPVDLVGDPGVLFFRADFLEKYPAVIERMLLAVNKAIDWAEKNPDEAAAIAAEALGTSDAAMKKVIVDGHLNLAFDQHLVEELANEAAFLKSQGLIPDSFDASSILDSSYMEAVLPELVTTK